MRLLTFKVVLLLLLFIFQIDAKFGILVNIAREGSFLARLRNLRFFRRSPSPQKITNKSPSTSTPVSAVDKISNSEENKAELLEYGLEAAVGLVQAATQRAPTPNTNHNNNFDKAINGSTKSNLECKSLQASRDIQAFKPLLFSLSKVQDKVIFWVRLRYHLKTKDFIPMDKDPSFWIKRIHLYKGWAASTAIRANSVVIIGESGDSKRKAFSLVGLVESFSDSIMCISHWDPYHNKLKVSRMRTSAAKVSIYKE
ncbi:hypothetical protein DSO57_1033660 [Entomophthora muscae]|uniref:Uncharacterized protein n=1 Tax=Entomophthora muscae TaxID=34485 RepID=A0ACC2TMG0_9FUNG|nr:hypothetical protein DSO57_1033660 [Entomophthora muscae]